MRKSPYLVSLLFLLAATILTLLSIYVPDLIHTTTPTPGPLHFETKYGLYRRCTLKIPETSLYILEPSSPSSHSIPSSIDLLKTFANASVGTWDVLDPIDGEGEGWRCRPFPEASECKMFGQGFCVLWSTAGYAAQLSLVPCAVSLIALLFISLGGGEKRVRAQRRAGGWKIVSSLMAMHCVLQIVSVGLILHVYRTDERFAHGHLDTASDFGVASALVSLSMVLALAFTGLAADAGKVWAGGRAVRRRKVHRRTLSGRNVVVVVREGDLEPSERTALLGEGSGSGSAGGVLRGEEGVVC